MAITFGMPSLGHTMEKGKIIEWLKHEGDPIAKGEPLVVIETDKVITEVESPADGVVLRIVVPSEEERPIGALLAVLGAQGEQVSEVELQQMLGPVAVQTPATSMNFVTSCSFPGWRTGPGPRLRSGSRGPCRDARGRKPSPRTLPGHR